MKQHHWNPLTHRKLPLWKVSCNFHITLLTSLTNSEAQHTTAKIVDTGDPEIQIIETTGPKMNLDAKAPRKRPHNPHIVYKDHSKNPLFKSTLQDHMRTLAASGLALNQHQAIALRLRVSSCSHFTL